MSPTKRPTIADIAEAAGVSKGAVSYALNGKAGVSAQTRERVVEIAARMGWHPSSAARALSDGRAGAIGLVVDRPARVLGIEPFFMQLISGVQAGLADTGTALLLQVTEDAGAEEAAYRRWWGERRVDGVLLVDLVEDDPRPRLLGELGLPALVVGHATGTPGVPSVWIDDAAAVRETLAYLAAMGHRRIARVAGPQRFVHTRDRGEVFERCAAELSLPGFALVHTDYSGEDGARATRRLLSGAARPTAIVYDNDVMAVAALGVAQEMGVSVPAELSVVAWDDSELCRLVHPALTAVHRRVPEYGERAAAALLALIGGADVPDILLDAPLLVPRGSTAPARR
ncbi:transcriptional regulator, LacI family [Streptomyces sp. DvalAA-14]|uniref:LacI family DNA-binding transcriptional regulator n=1 Tax=unclassified Streptomyces TaxID=2593676 RepID=UPI00081B3C51|nr:MULTISPECIES: LacI family DNA-binding transcriptional regulator [unclassified Streptomyces]MYS19656.1 substrate-binding domain-containing protein [Streptomyces sp. SID4948]SCD49860.1 transcriptional regulator, LacI family [Streptomyces sp. DvalAA-14]